MLDRLKNDVSLWTEEEKSFYLSSDKDTVAIVKDHIKELEILANALVPALTDHLLTRLKKSSSSRILWIGSRIGPFPMTVVSLVLKQVQCIHISSYKLA